MTLQEFFDLAEKPTLPLRFNIAPTQNVAAVRAKEKSGERELVLLRWGLIPSWAKDPKIGNRLINARADSVADKPSFRSAFKHRRCLVVADGYYEWKAVDKKTKQPYYITMRDGSPFGFAGLWEHWKDPEGKVVESCTLMTTEANELTKPIHDRMPVIVPKEQFAQWLGPCADPRSELLPLLKPFDSSVMAAYPVSTHVNNPRFDDAECVKPLA